MAFIWNGLKKANNGVRKWYKPQEVGHGKWKRLTRDADNASIETLSPHHSHFFLATVK